jgi:hypothetical protein
VWLRSPAYGEEWLIAHGADLRVKGGQFGTALKAAVAKKQYAVILFLEKYLSENELRPSWG